MSTFTHLDLFFFSGTGNSYRAALWMAEAARARGLESQVSPTDAAQPEREPGPERLLGLLCPTHAFCAPWAMLCFAMRLPRGRGASAFAMLTRAGMKVGRMFVPGLDGTGAYLLALILLIKGYRPVGAAGLDMPATWSVVMPALSPASTQAILARARPRAGLFLARMLDGRRCFWSVIPLALGILLLPLTFAYLVMGRFFLAKLFFASGKCDGCGLCARSCPVQAIRMRGQSSPRPYWTFLCESCTRCMNFCPKQAVEASYPFGALAYYLANIPVAVLLLDALARRPVVERFFDPDGPLGAAGPVVEAVIQYPYKLLALAVAYFSFSLALRIPQINRLFTLLTPTHYYRRYREPATKLKELR